MRAWIGTAVMAVVAACGGDEAAALADVGGTPDAAVADDLYEPFGTDPGGVPDVVATVPKDAESPSAADDSTATEDAELDATPDVVAPCVPPVIPVLAGFPRGLAITLGADAVAVAAGDVAAPDAWTSGGALTLPTGGDQATLFARFDACPEVARAVVTLVEALPGPATAEDTDAIPLDAPRAWATEVVSVVYGGGVDPVWRTPEKAVGPATGDIYDVLVLGNGGSAVLALDPPATDGPGPDLAVFENSFGGANLEVAFVEVSSDGATWARFASLSLTPSPVPTYGGLDPSHLSGLAGKHAAGWGTPFDLATLAGAPEVLDGRVDLGAVRYVRLLDIVGDGTTPDSFGHPIYDPTPAFGSGGFDLEAVGVL